MLTTILDRAKAQLDDSLPFVLYSKPGEQFLKAIFQSDDFIHRVTTFSEQGFVFAPFLDTEAPMLIKADEVQKIKLDNSPKALEIVSYEMQSDSREEERYTGLVQKAISEIKTGNCKKIVLSRQIEVTLSKPILLVYEQLLNTYPNAFCYLWYHPKVGMWAGATPEILLKSKGLEFTTMSLAGTQNQKQEGYPKWGMKEREEQQLVTDYIEDVLKNKAEQVQVSNSETIKAGHLWHLRTKITGKFSKGTFNNLITGLHPTPAVCGFPLKSAKEFILKNEEYLRSYYTGFLGELNFKNDRTRNRNQRNQENSAYRSVVATSELYVNLRCMQIRNDKAIVYVGGGITKDSNAKKEWLETQSKAQTMLRVLNT